MKVGQTTRHVLEAAETLYAIYTHRALTCCVATTSGQRRRRADSTRVLQFFERRTFHTSDTLVRYRRCRQRRQPTTARELCGYATFVPYWRQRARAVCTRRTVCIATENGGSFCDTCRAAPLFQSPDGMVPTTAYCLDIARDMCVAIGEPAAE